MKWKEGMFTVRVNERPGPTGPYYLKVVKVSGSQFTSAQFLVVEDAKGNRSGGYARAFVPAPFQPGGLVWWQNPTTLEIGLKKQLRALAADKPDEAEQLKESFAESLKEFRKSIRDCGEGPFRIQDIFPFPGGGAVLLIELPNRIAEFADDLLVPAETAVVN